MGYKVKKRGKNYWIFGRVKGIRIDSSLRTTNKRQAEEIARIIYTKAVDGVFGIRTTRAVKLSRFLDLYIEEYCVEENRDSTVAKKRSIVNRILRGLQDKDIVNITRKDIIDYRAKRRREVSPATVNRELALLKHAFNVAIEWGYLNENPAARIPILKEPDGRNRYLSVEEIRLLLEACPDWLRPIVITPLHTGMRRGEVLTLKWGCVDLDRKQVKITQENSKTQNSRVVPINETLYNTLLGLGPKGEGYVFEKEPGVPYKEIKESFNKAVKEAGIDDFRFHDLRHTFASHLVMAGIPLEAVGKLLGHKTPQMTWRYAHLSPDYMDRTVEILHKINTKSDNEKEEEP